MQADSSGCLRRAPTPSGEVYEAPRREHGRQRLHGHVLGGGLIPA